MTLSLDIVLETLRKTKPNYNNNTTRTNCEILYACGVCGGDSRLICEMTRAKAKANNSKLRNRESEMILFLLSY